MKLRFAQAIVPLATCGWLALCASPAAAQGEEAPHGAAVHEAEGETHAAGGHGGGRDFTQAPLPPGTFALQVFLFTLVLFGFFFFFMKKTGWQDLAAGLNEREARILRAEHDAMMARSEAERFHAEADRRMAEVQGQVKEILDRARAEADTRRHEIVAAAIEEAARTKDQALREIAEARRQAVDELSKMVDGQATVASQQIAGRSFN